MNAVRVLLILAAAQFGWMSSASGGLILSVEDLTLPAGGTGFVDVTIKSDGVDALNLFTFEVQILPFGAPQGLLEFTSPQPDPQLADLNYVLFGNSIKSLGIPVGNVGQTVSPNDTFAGEDFTVDLSDVGVEATERLLLRLQVTASAAAAPLAGDQFSIVLTDLLFLSSDGSLVPFESTPGTVTVAAAAAVPEPASISLLCLGALGLVVKRRRSARRG